MQNTSDMAIKYRSNAEKQTINAESKAKLDRIRSARSDTPGMQPAKCCVCGQPVLNWQAYGAHWHGAHGDEHGEMQDPIGEMPSDTCRERGGSE
jgi:hypothetical protein